MSALFIGVLAAVLALPSVLVRSQTGAAAVPTKSAIAPRTWWVLPRADDLDVERELARCVLAPETLPPFAKAPVATTGWTRCDAELPHDAAIACTTVVIEHDEVRLAALSGAAQLFVNGEGFVGDVERRGHGGVPVALHAGANELVVCGIDGSFKLELRDPVTPLRIGTWDLAWPGFGVGDPDMLSFPVFNAQLVPVNELHVHYGNARPEGGDCEPFICEWRDGGTIAPLSLFLATTYWHFFNTPKCTPPPDSEHELAPLQVYAGDRPVPRPELDADYQVVRHAKKDAPKSPGEARGWTAASRSLLTHTGTNVVLVHGTRGSREGMLARLAHARLDQERLWYRFRIVPTLISDERYVAIVDEGRGNLWTGSEDVELSECSLVLYGNADTNAAWVGHFRQEIADVREGRIAIAGSKHEGDELFGCITFRARDPGWSRGNVALFDTGVVGARAASFVDLWAADVPSDAHAIFRVDLSAPSARLRISAAPK